MECQTVILSFFLYILPDPLSSIIGRCTLYIPGILGNATVVMFKLFIACAHMHLQFM